MSFIRTSIAAGALAIGLLVPSTPSAQQAAHGDEGTRTPTPEQARRMADAMRPFVSTDATGLTERTLRNGAVLLDLGGRFQSVTVARTTASGVATSCVASTGEAEAFAAGEPAHVHASKPTPTLEEK